MFPEIIQRNNTSVPISPSLYQTLSGETPLRPCYNHFMKKLELSTASRNQIIDITDLVQKAIDKETWQDGLVLVYCPHTTAAISVNENADPDVKTDMNAFLKELVPQRPDFQHAEGNSDAHIKGTLAGFSQTFIIENGELQLGTWQGIYFMEFDGPRRREVWLKYITAS